MIVLLEKIRSINWLQGAQSLANEAKKKDLCQHVYCGKELIGMTMLHERFVRLYSQVRVEIVTPYDATFEVTRQINIIFQEFIQWLSIQMALQW